MWKWIALPLVFYGAVVVMMFLAQRSMLYLPDRSEPDAGQLRASGLRPWPERATQRGVIRDYPDARMTVVVFHGNAGQAADRHYYADALAFLDARVLLAEYPGYGGRIGKPSETVLVEDARETIRLMASTYPNEPLYVAGESLGAGVAAAAVGDSLYSSRDHEVAVDGLLLITPWDSLVSVARRHYAYLPVRWLLLDRYDSIRHLAKDARPKAVILAENDRIIPVEHGQRLFDALDSPRYRVVIEDAGHNDWFTRFDRADWQAVFDALAPGSTHDDSAS